MLSKQIENAQKKVEEQNFLIRKRVLEYDDVMNEQRRVVYRYRREVLEGRDMGDIAREQVGERRRAARSPSTRSPTSSRSGTSAGSRPRLNTLWPSRVDLAELDPQTSSRETSSSCSPRTPSPPTTSARRSSARS